MRSLITVLALNLLVACSAGGPGVPFGDAGVDVSVGDSGKRCVGTANACKSLTAEECVAAEGCLSADLCTGTAGACAGRSQSSCPFQKGCVWFEGGGSASCQGTPTACSAMTASSCTSQSGCSLVTQCDGSATACQELSASQCGAQPGCKLE